MMPEYKIRVRQRYESSPPVGISGEWTEYQIIHGRKIVKRCGTEREAEMALARLMEESSK